MMGSPTKEIAFPLMPPVVGTTNGGFPVWPGSLLGTRKGLTHCGAAGVNEPVLLSEKAGLYASAIAVALTEAEEPPHILAKKSGRLVRCRVTVTLGLPRMFGWPGGVKSITGALTNFGGDPATLF